MPLYHGGQRIAKLYKGPLPIAKAYRGVVPVLAPAGVLSGLPLDGISGTLSAAWSMSRDLLSEFGGDRYTTATGVSALNDQSGNGRHLTQATAGAQPAAVTAGPQSREAVRFDGANDFLAGAALSNFIANNGGYVIACAIVESIPSNSGNAWQNAQILGNAGGHMGLALRDAGGAPNVRAWNWDTNADEAPAGGSAFTLDAVHVFEWLHSGGELFLRVDGGSWSAPVTSGNTATSGMSYALYAGRSQNNWYTDMDLFEAVIFSAPPDAGDMTALAASMLAHYA